MFVFTVSCDVSQDVYVGSAKESIEAQWASIVAAADEGQEGALQAAIRLHGVENFSVEEWAFAENSRELRELLSEAKETLGAKSIKLGRVSEGASKRSGATQVSSDIRELFSMAKAEYESELVEELIPAEGLERKAKTAVADEKNTSSTNQGARISRAAEKEELPASEKVANGRSGSASKEKRIKEAITAEREQRAVLRQQQASMEAKEMQAVLLQIEQRRLAQKKKPTASKSSKSKTSLRSALSSKPPKSSTSSTSKTAVKAPAKVAVAKGRTGSSLKEKRIKEAIAQEKASIEAAKRQQAESQADEMAAILNRLDERNKAAATYKRKL